MPDTARRLEELGGRDAQIRDMLARFSSPDCGDLLIVVATLVVDFGEAKLEIADLKNAIAELKYRVGCIEKGEPL